MGLDLITQIFHHRGHREHRVEKLKDGFHVFKTKFSVSSVSSVFSVVYLCTNHLYITELMKQST